MSSAANVVIRLIRIVPPSIFQTYSLDLVESLSPLLSCQQLEVSLPCAVALNAILVNVRETKEKQVWKILQDAKAVVSIVGNLQNFSEGSMSVEWFQEMALLLSAVMLKWPQSRYSVWNNPALMVMLESVILKPDMGLKFATLKLYSSVGIYGCLLIYLVIYGAIKFQRKLALTCPFGVPLFVSALCGHGASELLDNGKPMLDMMINCMDESSPQYARIEGLKLAQRLAVILPCLVDLYFNYRFGFLISGRCSDR